MITGRKNRTEPHRSHAGMADSRLRRLPCDPTGPAECLRRDPGIARILTTMPVFLYVRAVPAGITQ